MTSNAFDAIKKHDVIVIHRHLNPDGDAMGSQLGLKCVLQTNFPDKKIYAVGDSAGRFSFMEGSVMDEISNDVYKDALAIVLDTSAKSLISDDRYTLAKTTMRIDHHIFVEDIADVDIDDTSFESCCGLVTYLVREWGLTIDSCAAQALYTGIVTDSGRFYYGSTSPRTLALASFLLEKGFNPADIYSNLYVDTYENVKKRAQFVLSIQFTPDNVAYSYSDEKRVRELDMEPQSISRGFVNTMGDLKGVDAWVNFTECEQGVLCEIRSKNLNINQIAVAHGGGGHLKASGATLKDRQEAMQVLEELNALVREGERI